MLTILYSAPYMIPLLPRYRPLLEGLGLQLIVPEVHERLDENQLLAYAGQFDGTICGDDHYTAACLASLLPPAESDLQVGHRDRFDRPPGC